MTLIPIKKIIFLIELKTGEIYSSLLLLVIPLLPSFLVFLPAGKNFVNPKFKLFIKYLSKLFILQERAEFQFKELSGKLPVKKLLSN